MTTPKPEHLRLKHRNPSVALLDRVRLAEERAERAEAERDALRHGYANLASFVERLAPCPTTPTA